MDPVGFAHHNHHSCIDQGVKAAQARCAREGLQFTPVRQRVLEILLAEHRALGAYDILEVLRSEGRGSQPPVAYRALEFLVRHGFAHKIERLNAFIACAHPGAQHTPAFLICRSCDHVAETHVDLSGGPLGEAAETAGFAIERTVIEALGHCPNCREAG